MIQDRYIIRSQLLVSHQVASQYTMRAGGYYHYLINANHRYTNTIASHSKHSTMHINLSVLTGQMKNIENLCQEHQLRSSMISFGALLHIRKNLHCSMDILLIIAHMFFCTGALLMTSLLSYISIYCISLDVASLIMRAITKNEYANKRL